MTKKYLMLSLLAWNTPVLHMYALSSKKASAITSVSAIVGAAIGLGLAKHMNGDLGVSILCGAGIAALVSWDVTRKCTPTGIMNWADKSVAALKSNEKINVIKNHIHDEKQLIDQLDALYGPEKYADYPDRFSSYPRLQMVDDFNSMVSQCDHLRTWLCAAQSDAQKHDKFNAQRCQEHHDYVGVVEDMVKQALDIVKKSDQYKEQKKIYTAVQKALERQRIITVPAPYPVYRYYPVYRHYPVYYSYPMYRSYPVFRR